MKLPIAFHVLVLVSIVEGTIPRRIGSTVDQSLSTEICVVTQIENGQAKKSTSRVVKYTCNNGFQRVGTLFSTCIGGEWNPPAPVCVSAGCDPLIPPINSHMSSSYRGASVKFICDPGFQLTGSPALHCNQTHWNSTAPTCDPIISKPATSCDFEGSNICGWTQDTKDDVFDWARGSSKTPSGKWGTGPSFDHTFGIEKKGSYMYIEASRPRRENDTAKLFSPVYNQDGQMSASGEVTCFQMWYHMFGSAIGSMSVYLKVDGNLTQLWNARGNQGDQWFQATMQLQPPANKTFQIVIEGIRGSGYSGDAAIDDVSILQGDSCWSSTNSSATDPSEESSTPVSYTSNYLQNTTDNDQTETTQTSATSTSLTNTTIPLPSTTPLPATPPMTTLAIATTTMETTSVSKPTLQPADCTNMSITRSDRIVNQLHSGVVDIPIAIGIAIAAVASTALLIALVVKINKRHALKRRVDHEFSTSELRFLTAEELMEESN